MTFGRESLNAQTPKTPRPQEARPDHPKPPAAPNPRAPDPKAPNLQRDPCDRGGNVADYDAGGRRKSHVDCLPPRTRSDHTAHHRWKIAQSQSEWGAGVHKPARTRRLRASCEELRHGRQSLAANPPAQEPSVLDLSAALEHAETAAWAAADAAAAAQARLPGSLSGGPLQGSLWEPL